MSDYLRPVYTDAEVEIAQAWINMPKHVDADLDVGYTTTSLDPTC